MRYIKLITVVIFSLLVICQGVRAGSSWVHGEIVEVSSETNQVKVLINDQVNVLEVESTVDIFRNGKPASLNSARPITAQSFQEGLFFLNDNGKVGLMIIDYSITEIATSSSTLIIYYDIFGNVKDVEQIPSLLKESAIF